MEAQILCLEIQEMKAKIKLKGGKGKKREKSVKWKHFNDYIL